MGEEEGAGRRRRVRRRRSRRRMVRFMVAWLVG